MKHSECVKKLIEVGKHFGFHATGRGYGKMYHMGNPDCVWYYKGKGAKSFTRLQRVTDIDIFLSLLLKFLIMKNKKR